ncbi:AbrB/MazE/SpoVT family DNA-binding domain-containing protein [Aquimarina sp. MAR_2010_214]|uniref:AbrB/MazE/SpoVT family DNA-binding domain-containing protein n=1 Tax=Aquimarina sp. MAR_2010_214 TaxID=1250026 RepID=UPI001177A688|nr:AbrB/MazE/SpoVT family DNA-binding domain-containing protein [Aquimarina sp. MAR_2010_214]
MMITSKGQITIPKKYREVLELFPHTDVEFEHLGRDVKAFPFYSFQKIHPINN